jgi:hypothetical protein
MITIIVHPLAPASAAQRSQAPSAFASLSTRIPPAWTAILPSAFCLLHSLVGAYRFLLVRLSNKPEKTGTIPKVTRHEMVEFVRDGNLEIARRWLFTALRPSLVCSVDEANRYTRLGWVLKDVTCRGTNCPFEM